MKTIFTLLILLFSFNSFSQNQNATTESGKKVILKSDKTWEYADAKSNVQECTLEKDAVKGNEALRKHAAVENDCEPKDVKFIAMAQGYGTGTYSLCVKGKIMKYKKMGTVFMKADANPMGN